MSLLSDLLARSSKPGKCRPPQIAERLMLALEVAIDLHEKLRPPQPTGADQLPQKMREYWERTHATLETLHGSLVECGDRIYSVERVAEDKPEDVT